MKTLKKHHLGLFLIFAVMLVIYLYTAHLLITSFDFNDETEKFIAARLMGTGLKLYKDIFVQHGPVPYLLSHMFYLFSASHSLADYRLIPIGLSLLTLFFVMTSPLFTSMKIRLFVGALFLFGLTSFQVNYDFVMTMYQVYAGYFLVMALATFVLPFSMGIKTRPYHACVAGFSLSWMFFCAFSFAFCIVCCSLLCIFPYLAQKKPANQTRQILCAFLGAFIGTLLIVLWLFFYGDYWGYYVDHIYFNLVVYKKFLNFGERFLPLYLRPLLLLQPFFILSLKEFYPLGLFLLHFLPVLIIFLLTFFLYHLKQFGCNRLPYLVHIILVLGILIYSNPRCTGRFAESTYVLTSIGLVALFAGFILEQKKLRSSATIILVKGLVALFVFSGIYTQFTIKTPLYGVSTYEYYTHTAVLGPSNSEDMQFLRQIVAPDEGVLQLPFNLLFYVWSDRLPATGIFYWLPWMDAYIKHPLNGYPLDLCEQMKKTPPKVIYYTDDAIWDNPTEVWMSCFKKLLKDRYFVSTKMANIWFRDDVALSQPNILNTSYVPEDFEGKYLSVDLKKKADMLKLHYAKLVDVHHQRCILQPKQAHGSLRIGDCNDKHVLLVAFNKDENKLLSLQDHQCLDLEIDTKEKKGSIRLWPCFETPFQTFTREINPNGFYIHNSIQGLCSTIKENRVIQMPCSQATLWKWMD